MSRIGRPLLVAAVATAIAAIGWRSLSNRRRRKARLHAARAEFGGGGVDSREGAIEALNAEEREQMLRELSNLI